MPGSGPGAPAGSTRSSWRLSAVVRAVAGSSTTTPDPVITTWATCGASRAVLRPSFSTMSSALGARPLAIVTSVAWETVVPATGSCSAARVTAVPAIPSSSRGVLRVNTVGAPASTARGTTGTRRAPPSSTAPSAPVPPSPPPSPGPTVGWKVRARRRCWKRQASPGSVTTVGSCCPNAVPVSTGIWPALMSSSTLPVSVASQCARAWLVTAVAPGRTVVWKVMTTSLAACSSVVAPGSAPRMASATTWLVAASKSQNSTMDSPCATHVTLPST